MKNPFKKEVFKEKFANRFHAKNKKEKVTWIVFTIILFIFLFFGLFGEMIFRGTVLEIVIANSMGKFFNLFRFFGANYVILLESLTIIIFMWLVSKLLTLLIILFTRKGKRRETVGNLLKSVTKYVSVIVAIFLILSAWGVQTTTLLAGAGIVGLALSFGAQSLIEDVISGLFIIFEEQFLIGDVIEIGSFRGIVTDIGIRVTKFEDINGDIKTINNSDIRSAINTSSHLSPAICNVTIAYGESIERVEEILRENLPTFKEKIPDIVEGPFYRGVDSLGDSGVVIRLYAKTEESKKYQVVRDMNREVKVLFDQNHIEIPFTQIVLHYANNEKDEKRK